MASDILQDQLHACQGLCVFDMCFKTSVCQCLCCWFVMYFKTSWLCLQDRWRNSNDDDVLINTAKPYSVINIGYSNNIGETRVVRTSARD